MNPLFCRLANRPLPAGQGSCMDLVQAFERCSSSLLSDALQRVGLTGAVGGFGFLSSPSVVVGTAVTVKLGPAGGQPAPSHLGANAIRAAASGQIIVVGNDGDRSAACWGSLLTRAAKVKGVAGVIVDGMVRDADEIHAMGLPTLALGTSPLTARGRFAEVGTNVPIVISGVRVLPGDYVLFDRTGFVVIPQSRATDVLRAAQEIRKFEGRFESALSQGQDPVGVLGERYELLLRDTRE